MGVLKELDSFTVKWFLALTRLLSQCVQVYYSALSITLLLSIARVIHYSIVRFPVHEANLDIVVNTQFLWSRSTCKYLVQSYLIRSSSLAYNLNTFARDITFSLSNKSSCPH